MISERSTMRKRIGLSFLLVLSIVISIANGQTPVTQQLLIEVAGSLQMYVDRLPQMPRLTGYSVQNGNAVPATLTIGMYQKTWKFHRDLPNTTVFVYGTSQDSATFPGPTIEAMQGTPLSIKWENHLPQTHILPWDATIPTAIPKNGGVPTVVHLHGSVHPPQSDGSALAWFTANYQETGPKWTTTTYTYPNVQPAGNLWYHDHALGLTRNNLLAGLIGTYIIRNPSLDARLNLPMGQFDQQLVIVDRSFNTDGSLYMNSTGDNPSIHPEWQPEYFGEAIIVNGKAWPYLSVVRRRYRFRILNASNARYFRLSLSNGTPLYVVGHDASYLASPVQTWQVLLGPAEMADVVIDFSMSTTDQAELINDAPYPFPSGTPSSPLNGKIMQFLIKPGVITPYDNSTVPSSEVNYTTAIPSVAVNTRYITLYESLDPISGLSTHLYINGLRFEDPVTETPRAGTTEIWNVINLTGDNHPFHMHLGMMQAVKVQQLVDLNTFTSCMIATNDTLGCNITVHATGPVSSIPMHERTWKNTVKIEPGAMTSIVVKFQIVDTLAGYPFDATPEPGYVYHCHILDHEDNAMIRPMKILP
ncbi:hypothetical protein LUZ60_002388 [Juncus effusus]|nr:hypothetical protein LUZ60_002388 [Juncus effusus]